MSEPAEKRCPNCFHVVTGNGEWCSEFCHEQYLDWESAVTVYPVDEKRARLAVVP